MPKEHDRVTLRLNKPTRDFVIPKATKGTIMHVYRSGCFEVEFGHPYNTVITCTKEDLLEK